MGAQCSGPTLLPSMDYGIDAVTFAEEPRVEEAATEQVVRSSVSGELVEEVNAVFGKQSLHSSSSPVELRPRTPTWCAPEAVMGEWATNIGIYSITLNDNMQLAFQENSLHGVLQFEEEWYVAEIRDGTDGDEVFGYLRLRREGEIIKSFFKTKFDASWESSTSIEATPLPYLRTGARAVRLLQGLQNGRRSSPCAVSASRPWMLRMTLQSSGAATCTISPASAAGSRATGAARCAVSSHDSSGLLRGASQRSLRSFKACIACRAESKEMRSARIIP